MIKNVTEITCNSEKSQLDVMTFHDVIRVANENTRDNLYIPVSLLGSVGWSRGHTGLNTWTVGERVGSSDLGHACSQQTPQNG